MAQHEVDDLELFEAQVAGWVNRLSGADHLHVRELGDGRAVYLLPLFFGFRVGVGAVGAPGMADVWDYQNDVGQTLAAWRAALGWDGEGEPEGWYRHARSGRRRPDGDRAREHGEGAEAQGG